MTRQRRQITRRDFLRIAGITGVSAGAAGLPSSPLKPATPLTANEDPAGRSLRPWWVQTVDEPTVEINWDQMTRFDARNAMRGQGLLKHIGEEELDRLTKIAAAKEKQRILDNVPGYTLKDQALSAAQYRPNSCHRYFLGPQAAQTPEDRDVPKWSGSSEEAARILRAAMRHFGAATIGFVELNERTRKLIYSHDPDGKELVFEDADEAYETGEKRVIPNKARWVIVFTVRMSPETFKRAPTVTASQTTSLAYSRGLQIQNKTQEFLRGLGYQCLGEAVVNGLGISPAFAVMAGLGELSRANRLITPEFGPMVRIFKLITDLPLVADKPINAGIMEFCKQCKKCAEACPADALSFEDETTWNVQGDWNNPGHRAYFENSIKCYTYRLEETGTNCGICFAVCPFSKKDKAWIHNWVKATIALAPATDGFFRSMDDAFSYGAQKDPEEWWRLDLPEYGINTESTT